MKHNACNKTAETAVKPVTAKAAAICSQDLFGKCRQVAISHNGVIYYLHITGNNKLILTK